MTLFLEQALPRRDANANALLALTVLLILTTWSFFGRFSIVVAAAGVATSIWLGWWNLRHPPSPARSLDRQPPMLNISAVYVGADAAGLAFVVGCVVIFVMGLPPLRWFVLASSILAVLFALAVIGWHRTHSVWSEPTASLRRPV
jgi:hypothetical protein